MSTEPIDSFVNAHHGSLRFQSSNSSSQQEKQKQQNQRQTREQPKQSRFSTGPWTEKEHFLFLQGLLYYGWGQWREIGSVVTTR
jgi:hypothetical protein